MSATLTWANSGLGTKTNTTVGAFFDDLDTLITSFSANSAFSWQTAGKNSTATSPQYIVLSRKGGSNGRILIVNWSSSPAGNNAAILDQAPTLNNIYIAWFPNGTANTPSNLTASSGTIMGNDTSCLKVAAAIPLSSVYGTSQQHFYFDSAEGIVFGSNNPAAATTFMYGAGLLVVDSADVAYDAVFSAGSNSVQNFGSSSSPPIAWSLTNPLLAGTATACVRTNYGAANRVSFPAWAPSGAWAAQAIGASDVLTDTGLSAVWYVPCQLLGQTKGEGFKIKFRQLGYGPGSTGPFTVYNTTGPVVAARQFCATTTGGVGFPWFTNFKI